MIPARTLVPVAALMLLFGCGGGGGGGTTTASSTTASSLSYSDPSGTGWRLVKDTTNSTSTRLVLSLVGPTATKARGVALTLTAPSAQLSYGKFSDGTYIQDGGTFELYVSDSSEPQLLAGGVQSGSLTLGVFQKGSSQTAKSCGTTLLQFALDIADGASTGSASLTVSKAQMLSSSSALQTITVSTGTVTLQ